MFAFVARTADVAADEADPEVVLDSTLIARALIALIRLLFIEYEIEYLFIHII